MRSGKSSCGAKIFRMTPKIDKNYEISTFREIGQNFGNVLSGELQFNFSGPAGGSRTRKGAFADESKTKWLVKLSLLLE